MSRRRARIGVSACFMHADPQRPLFKGKTLLYAEESFLQWVMSEGAVPVMLPRVSGALTVRDVVDEVDGLFLQGGADMAPGSYGQSPLKPEWGGDAARDAYEIELIRACLAENKPVLGVCRGVQVLNVALGGTLYQDLPTLHPEKRVHRDWEIYDQHFHDVSFEAGSWIGRWYQQARGKDVAGGRVNSVHHQGLHTLGRGLVVEARSAPDGVIEAVRYAPPGEAQKSEVVGASPFAYGVQWHPEFMHTGTLTDADLDPVVILRAFLAEVEARRQT